MSAPRETIDAARLPARDAYRLMTDLVAPRPIAWVSTQDEGGHRNLAPFSYFQGVCSNPPTVILGIGWNADGRPKDTLRNILATREFTINHVSESLAEAMNATSGAYPPQVDEWERAGVAAAASDTVAPPRVAEAHAALECKLVHAIPIGRGRTGKPSSTLVVGRIVSFSVAAGLIERDELGHFRPIDPARLAAVGRLGGIAYTKTRQTLEMARPVVTAAARSTKR